GHWRAKCPTSPLRIFAQEQPSFASWRRTIRSRIAPDFGQDDRGGYRLRGSGRCDGQERANGLIWRQPHHVPDHGAGKGRRVSLAASLSGWAETRLGQLDALNPEKARTGATRPLSGNNAAGTATGSAHESDQSASAL